MLILLGHSSSFEAIFFGRIKLILCLIVCIDLFMTTVGVLVLPFHTAWFLFSHTLYTRLDKLANTIFLYSFVNFSLLLIHSDICIRSVAGVRNCIWSFHFCRHFKLNSHLKNGCALFSPASSHTAHLPFWTMPHCFNLSLVFSLSILTNQHMKLCFGML